MFYTQLSLDEGFEVLAAAKNDRLVRGRHVSLASGKILFESLRSAGQPLKCWSCGIEANCFIVNKGSNDRVGAPTIDLFADTGTDVVLMTRDHIIPRSYGGVNLVENLRIGCGPCNHSRGNALDAEDLEFMKAHPELIVHHEKNLTVPENGTSVEKTESTKILTEAKREKLRLKRKAQRRRKAAERLEAKAKRLPPLTTMMALALA